MDMRVVSHSDFQHTSICSEHGVGEIVVYMIPTSSCD